MRGILVSCALLSAFLATDDALARQKRLYPSHAPGRQAAPARIGDDAYFSNYLSEPGGRKTPVMEYPGSATVVTRKMMDDMNARNLCDALRYTPGVFVSGCW